MARTDFDDLRPDLLEELEVEEAVDRYNKLLKLLSLIDI
jgi:hypothetical protein